MRPPEFDEFAKDYDSVLAASIPDGLNEDVYFAKYKIDLVAERHPARSVQRILDYGCGAGRSLPFLRERYPDAEIWGYDVSEQSIAQAAQRVPDAKLFSDWRIVKNAAFDLIIAANVFHHIPLQSREAALIGCRQAMAREGSTYIFEHNPYNPVTRHVFENCPFDINAEMLTMRQARELAQASGLRVACSAYTLFFPKPLKWLRPLEQHLQWLPIGAQYYVQLAH